MDHRTLPLNGSYLLLIALSDERSIRVGGLGEISFKPGVYLYCGSAMNGFRNRVGRHFRKEKKVRWHIDHLLQLSEPFGALLFTEGNVTECRIGWALSQTGLVRPPCKGFGSSDCDCHSHLFYLEDEGLLAILLSALRRSVTD